MILPKSLQHLLLPESGWKKNRKEVCQEHLHPFLPQAPLSQPQGAPWFAPKQQQEARSGRPALSSEPLPPAPASQLSSPPSDGQDCPPPGPPRCLSNSLLSRPKA